MKKQHGYINLDGVFTALIIFGIVVGAVAALAFNYGIPWLWQFVKPWLHALTA